MTLRALIILILCIGSPSLLAGMRINDFSTGGNTFTFTPWSGPGPATLIVDFCVTSVQGRRRTSTTPLPYEIKARDRASASNPLQLSATSGSGEVLPLSITFTDLYNNQGVQLSPNTYTAQDKSGGLFQCPNGLNARLEFQINANDLSSVSAGNYRGRLRLVARGGDNGTERKRSNITINLAIQDAVQLSGLDDILLGNYLGSGDVNASDDFCVYRNGSGAYEVTASGSGAGGSFAMQSGANQIPYRVSWNDGSSNSNLSSNTPLSGRQNIFTSSADCNGGANNNASITIQALESNLAPAIAGLYNGTLTLIIAPE